MLELLFQGFIEWIYGLILECWEYFASVLFDLMSLDGVQCSAYHRQERQSAAQRQRKFQAECTDRTALWRCWQHFQCQCALARKRLSS